ncbi:MAG: serine hydrolase [Mycobacteriales bacterium]
MPSIEDVIAAGRRASGRVSLWWGPPGGDPRATLAPHTDHYAASTMKVAVLAAAFREAEAGRLDLDMEIDVHDDFDSVHAGRFTMDRGYDGDDLPWHRLGERAPLLWVATRMIVGSSNLGTNLVLERVGPDIVQKTLAGAGIDGVTVRRGITDTPASDAGIHNTVTAAGLAALFGALALGRIASPAGCARMLDILRAQEHLEGIPAGLPSATRIASKGGWVDDLRHDAALVEPDGGPPYVLVVCTDQMGDEHALPLIHRAAAASWTERR